MFVLHDCLSSVSLGLLRVLCGCFSWFLANVNQAAGPRVWNSLPAELRQCDSVGHFKWRLKTTSLGYGTMALCDFLVKVALHRNNLTYLPLHHSFSALTLLVGW